jgi:Holliday junction resolvase
MQEGFYRSQRSNSEKIYTGKQWTKELIEFFWTHGNALWKIGASGTCLTKVPTTPALAYDKRLNNELKQHTRTVRAC